MIRNKIIFRSLNILLHVKELYFEPLAFDLMCYIVKIFFHDVIKFTILIKAEKIRLNFNIRYTE